MGTDPEEGGKNREGEKGGGVVGGDSHMGRERGEKENSDEIGLEKKLKMYNKHFQASLV